MGNQRPCQFAREIEISDWEIWREKAIWEDNNYNRTCRQKNDHQIQQEKSEIIYLRGAYIARGGGFKLQEMKVERRWGEEWSDSGARDFSLFMVPTWVESQVKFASYILQRKKWKLLPTYRNLNRHIFFEKWVAGQVSGMLVNNLSLATGSLSFHVGFSSKEDGPHLPEVQDQGDPWRGRSKLLSALQLSKIHLIEMWSNGRHKQRSNCWEQLLHLILN